MPHADTLERLLEKIEPGDIEAVLMARLRALFRRQKLRALMVGRGYVVPSTARRCGSARRRSPPRRSTGGESDEAR